MAVTIATGQRQSPNSFQNSETFTSQTTTTATSAAHGQALSPDIQISVLAGGTEVRTRNVYTLADGIQGQEKWITMASATGSSFISLSAATATGGYVIGDADDMVGLKFVHTGWHVTYNLGATIATATAAN